MTQWSGVRKAWLGTGHRVTEHGEQEGGLWWHGQGETGCAPGEVRGGRWERYWPADTGGLGLGAGRWMAEVGIRTSGGPKKMGAGAAARRPLDLRRSQSALHVPERPLEVIRTHGAQEPPPLPLLDHCSQLRHFIAHTSLRTRRVSPTGIVACTWSQGWPSGHRAHATVGGWADAYTWHIGTPPLPFTQVRLLGGRGGDQCSVQHRGPWLTIPSPWWRPSVLALLGVGDRGWHVTPH